jgi:nitrate reductase delta subunit
MLDNEINQIFQYCSLLLSYPDGEYRTIIEEVSEESANLADSQVKEELQQFLKKAKTLTDSDLVSIYINTFDFGKKTNLYTTYMTNGEQRERGMDLLFLKNYYQLHGFSVTDKELPDYLPIILEFASQVDLAVMKPVFERFYGNIKEIEIHLNPELNLYSHIFRTILLALEKVGITKRVRRSEEICSNSFYG